eukprot:1158458-Pelagomonas_calceolata.AAC.1
MEPHTYMVHRHEQTFQTFTISPALPQALVIRHLADACLAFFLENCLCGTLSLMLMSMLKQTHADAAGKTEQPGTAYTRSGRAADALLLVSGSHPVRTLPGSKL